MEMPEKEVPVRNVTKVELLLRKPKTKRDQLWLQIALVLLTLMLQWIATVKALANAFSVLVILELPPHQGIPIYIKIQHLFPRRLLDPLK
jgi:hypothetical protein